MMSNEINISFRKVPEALEGVEQVIEASINEQTGEVTCDLAAITAVAQLEKIAADGIDWYAENDAALAAQDKACDARIDDIQAEIDRLIAPYQERIDIYELRKRAIENRREYQKYMVGELLAALKTDTFVLPTGKKVYIQETESCEVTASQEEIALWPEKFRRVKYEPDKKVLKSADGEWLPSGVTFIKKRTVKYPK